MPPRFLDTNVLLRYFTRDDPAKAERVLALLQRVERAEEKPATSPLVIFEVVFTLQHSYGVPRTRIQELLEPVIALRGLRLANKRCYYRALELYAGSARLSFADAFNAAYMESLALTEIYSYDADFDRLPGVSRIEPD